MQKTITRLVQKNSSKIVLVVLDGLGGLPVDGMTELETARTPNMDRLARLSACGLHTPVAAGITPGSGPGHLSLFGYDPLEFQIGRGILEALGLGLEVRRTDIAVRWNYATIKDGLITDRRAGRIPTEQSRILTGLLQKGLSRIGNVELTFAAGMEHRLAIRMRFPHDLSTDAAQIPDTDPQKEGLAPLSPRPLSKGAEIVSPLAEEVIARAHEVLKNEAEAVTSTDSCAPTSALPLFVILSNEYGTAPAYAASPITKTIANPRIANLFISLSSYPFDFMQI